MNHFNNFNNHFINNRRNNDERHSKQFKETSIESAKNI